MHPPAVTGDKLVLIPTPPLVWQGWDGKLPLQGQACLDFINAQSKPVVLEADFPLASIQIAGKPYTSPPFVTPGSLASVVLQVNPATLSQAVSVRGQKVVTQATQGTYTLTVMVPAMNPAGPSPVPDPLLVKTGTWMIETGAQSVFRSGIPAPAPAPTPDGAGGTSAGAVGHGAGSSAEGDAQDHFVAVTIEDIDGNPLGNQFAFMTLPNGERVKRQLTPAGGARLDGIRKAGDGTATVNLVFDPSLAPVDFGPDQSFIAFEVIDEGGQPLVHQEIDVVIPGVAPITVQLSERGTSRIEGVPKEVEATVTLVSKAAGAGEHPAEPGTGDEGGASAGPHDGIGESAVDGGTDPAAPGQTPEEPPLKHSHVLEMAGASFRLKSAVVLPEGEDPSAENHQSLSSIGAFASVLRFNEESPGKKLFIAGHADTSGGEQLNMELSDERAECALALLIGARQLFADIADARHRISDYKQILSWSTRAFPQYFDCAPPEIDEREYPGVEPLRRFQAQYNAAKQELGATGSDIAVDGSIGPQTWGAIFDVYELALREELGADIAGLARLREQLTFVDDQRKALGFGEYHPADGSADGVRSQPNRRIEMLFFDSGEEPDLAAAEADPAGAELYQPTRYQREPIQYLDGEERVVAVQGTFDYVTRHFPLLDLPKAFDIAMRKVFGDDIPSPSIEALRRELVNGTFPEPRFMIASGLPDGALGAYSTGVVLVSRELVESAREVPLDRWKLLTVLLEEYGHFVDDQLRTRLGLTNGDAEGDEGTRFGAFYISYHELFTADFEFGTLTTRRGVGGSTTQLPLSLTLDQLGVEERAKFFLWSQEVGADSGFVQVDGKTFQAEYFKIEGQGAVHERITQEAAQAAGVTFDGRLDIGVAWPDVPTFDENSPPLPGANCQLDPRQTAYNSPHAAYAAFLRMEAAHAMGIADENSPPFKSHYGRNQIWHAMSPGSHLTNGQIVSAILRQHETWWAWALADCRTTRGVPLPIGILPQGLFHVGKVLHTVQDSFSGSHTIRDGNRHIVSFQDYTAQDAAAHGEHDKDRATKALHDIPGATEAVQHSTAILRLFRDRRPFAEVRAYLLEHVFKLAPGAENTPSGQVLEELRPRR